MNSPARWFGSDMISLVADGVCDCRNSNSNSNSSSGTSIGCSSLHIASENHGKIFSIWSNSSTYYWYLFWVSFDIVVSIQIILVGVVGLFFRTRRRRMTQAHVVHAIISPVHRNCFTAMHRLWMCCSGSVYCELFGRYASRSTRCTCDMTCTILFAATAALFSSMHGNAKPLCYFFFFFW